MDDFHLPIMYNSCKSTNKYAKDVDSVGLSCYTDTTLQLSSHCLVAPNNYQLRSGRRNFSDGSEISLSLELGSSCSPFEIKAKSFGTTLTCDRMFEQQAPAGMCLDLDLNIQDKRECEVRNLGISHGVSKEEKPKIDLELSLSTAVAESDVTSITLSSSPVQNSIEIQALSDITQLVDEGSTSSKWKRGPLLPHSDSQQSADMLLPFLTCSNKGNTISVAHDIPSLLTGSNIVNPVSVASDIPSIPAQPSKSVDCTGTSRLKPLRKSAVKTCQFPGCEKGARGASGLCISHGGGRRCQRSGCQKGAEGKTAFCKAHGGGRRCEHLGCTKSAEGRTNLCIAHGGGRRCNFPEGCTRAARGRSGLCIRHGGGKRCKIENCTKSAEGLSCLCIAHGGGRRCQFPQCTKGAQGSTKFCKAHGGGKRCTFVGCTKGAEGSTPFCKGHGGGKRCSFQGGGVCTKSVHGGTLFCVAHGGGKRCAIPECTKSARGRTNFCVRHGGGKRCKYEGCGKSAQGSTDFCKAHGRGKRCLWGQPGSGIGSDDTNPPCDKFAREKVGLCAAHAALIHDNRVHGNGTVGLKLKEIMAVEDDLAKYPSNNISGQCSAFGFGGHQPQLTTMQNVGECDAPSGLVSLPEGRVHGGRLLSLLMGGVGIGVAGADQLAGCSSGPKCLCESDGACNAIVKAMNEEH